MAKPQHFAALEDLNEDQIYLRGYAAGLFVHWIWPALLRVEGSPERAAAYVLTMMDGMKDEMPEPGIYGELDDMRQLSAAAFQISDK